MGEMEISYFYVNMLCLCEHQSPPPRRGPLPERRSETVPPTLHEEEVVPVVQVRPHWIPTLERRDDPVVQRGNGGGVVSLCEWRVCMWWFSAYVVV